MAGAVAKVQAKEAERDNMTVCTETEAAIQSALGGGKPIVESVRTFFESRFGADFSDVRVHADNMASRCCRELKAKAFTYGRDVFFDTGRYEPQTTEGKHLLAHELTHTVQQQCDRSPRRLV